MAKKPVVAMAVTSKEESIMIDAKNDSAVDSAEMKEFFEQTYKYWDRLYAIAYSMLHLREDAEDAVQDVLVKAAHKQKQFEFRSQVYTWLVRILINHCHDILRVNKKKKTRSLDENAGENANLKLQIVDKRQDLEKNNEQNEASLSLMSMVGSLEDIYRDVVILRYFEEMKYNEIADILDISEGTVKSRLNNAKKILKSMLEAKGVGGDFLVEN